MKEQITAERVRQDFLLGKRKMISIVGAGGKTSLLLYLASLLRGRSPVIITTTTKMMLPDSSLYDRAFESIDQLKAAFTSQTLKAPVAKTFLVHEGYDPSLPHKLQGITPEAANSLLDLPATILIEADGARKLPLKWPKEKEPVVPKKSLATLGVLPIDLLGQEVDQDNFYNLHSFMETVHYRPKQVDAALMRTIITHPKGLFKDAAGDKVLVLTRCEHETFARQGKDLIHWIFKTKPRPIDQAFILSVKEMKIEDFSHYTCCWPSQEDGSK